MESDSGRRSIVPSIIFLLWTIAAFAAVVSLLVFPFTKGVALGLIPVILGVGFCFVPLFSKGWIPVIGKVLQSGSDKTWLLATAILAFLVRIPVLLFPSPLHSDMFYYYRAAKLLASGASGAWGRNGLGVYYPPGQSIWLSLWIALLGDHAWVVPVAQGVLGIASLPLLYYALTPFSKRGGRIACLVVAFYPSLVLWSGTTGHETTQIFFLSLLLFLYTRAIAANGLKAVSLCISFGLALGAASLVRPTFPLLLPLTMLTEWIFSRNWMRVIAGSTIALVFMAVLIAPWTLRNYREYGHFCLVSAQAGGTLLLTARPESRNTIPSGEDLVTRDQRNMRTAVQILLHDPIRTTMLGLQNIVLEWGTDSSSVDSIVGDPPRGGEGLRKMIQAIENIFWAWFITAWLTGSLGGKVWLGQHSRLDLWSGLLLITVFAIHTLFEPQARHHFPVLPFMAFVFGPAYLDWSARPFRNRQSSLTWNSTDLRSIRI